MLAVASPPHGRGTTLAGAATLSQALLIQRGLGTGGRAPGKILLSRALTATHVASCRTKIIYSQIEDGTERRIGESHNAAQDRLARGVHAQTCCQAGSSFAAGRQSDGGELLAVADRHLCPGPNQVWKALASRLCAHGGDCGRRICARREQAEHDDQHRGHLAPFGDTGYEWRTMGDGTGDSRRWDASR